MLIDPTNKVTQEGQILETHGIHWLKKKIFAISQIRTEKLQKVGEN